MFEPDQKILEKYAQVLINFALNSGEGVKPGEVVRLIVNESAKPMYIALRNQILRSQAIPLTDYQPDDVAREYYELATSAQLKFFPSKFYRGLIDEIDHSVAIISETNKHELEGIDPKKIMLRNLSLKPAKDWRDAKENAGKFTWTLALYGTSAMAKEAGISLEKYWDQIQRACFLDHPDPIAKWREVSKENARIRARLNTLAVDRLHVEAKNVDLWITLGPNRRWLGGSGRNIPSFEVFISPDWRGTTGHIQFDQPLYRYGNLITDISLDFANGRVVNCSASSNENILKSMIATENADKIGEFSLTDKRLSRIDTFMAETLFDENMSGPWGNTHLALGSSYKDSYPGNLSKVSRAKWQAMGYNDSAVHTDIISTTRRTVTAYLKGGSQKTIYVDGQFTL